MKRIISVFTALFLLITLCACSAEKGIEESTVLNEQTADIEETLPEGKVAGQIYAVFGNKSDCSTEFICNEKVTPARICAGLTGWTGLKFRTNITVDEENKKMTVDWLEDSAFVSGKAPETQQEPFIFTEAETMRLFMINSLTKSINANLGEYEIIFTANGKNISTYGVNGVS